MGGAQSESAALLMSENARGSKIRGHQAMAQPENGGGRMHRTTEEYSEVPGSGVPGGGFICSPASLPPHAAYASGRRLCPKPAFRNTQTVRYLLFCCLVESTPVLP